MAGNLVLRANNLVMQAEKIWTRLEVFAKRVGYGAIKNLCIRDGTPDLTKPVTVEYSRLLSSKAPVNSKHTASDPGKKVQYQNLRRLCEQERDLVITKIIIQDGLPQQVKFQKEEMI